MQRKNFAKNEKISPFALQSRNDAKRIRANKSGLPNAERPSKGEYLCLPLRLSVLASLR